MTETKKVPLVVYEGGQRKVIGDAVVDFDGDSFDVTARITNPEYTVTTDSLAHISMGPFTKAVPTDMACRGSIQDLTPPQTVFAPGVFEAAVIDIKKGRNSAGS